MSTELTNLKASGIQSLTNIKRITTNYLEEIEAELSKRPEAPRKKTKAEKRAERKERRRLQAIEDKKLILRDALRRELELSKRMQQRGDEEWHEMCREIKLVELQKEIIEWGERAQRNLERKNDHIAMLLDDMEQTQEQHTHCYSKTVELIDHIRDCFHTLLDTVKNIYDEQAEEMLRDYEEEVRRRTDEVEFMHTHSENIIHCSNIVTRDELKEDYNIYLEKRDDRVNTEIENRFHIRDRIVQKMLEMQRQLNQFVDMLRNTELDAHKYERIRWLTERQAAFMEESRRLNYEEMKYLNMQNEMEREITRMETEDTTTINDLRLEFQYFSNVRKKIENSMQTDRKITHEKLRILTGEFYKVSKQFEKNVKSGELLLALSINCRKLQTQSEKIILGGELFDECPLGEVNEQFVLRTLDMQKHVDLTEDELVAQNRFLKNFWRRQAMAQAQNMLLLEEKRKLTAENQRYIDFVKKFTKTENAEELQTAVIVKPCPSQPPLRRCDTKCLLYKLTRRSPRKVPSAESIANDMHKIMEDHNSPYAKNK